MWNEIGKDIIPLIHQLLSSPDWSGIGGIATLISLLLACKPTHHPTPTLPTLLKKALIVA